MDMSGLLLYWHYIVCFRHIYIYTWTLYMFTVFVVCIYIHIYIYLLLYYAILFYIILDIYTYEQHPSEKINNLVYHLLEGCSIFCSFGVSLDVRPSIHMDEPARNRDLGCSNRNVTRFRNDVSGRHEQRLVGGLEHFLFSIIFGIILPID